MLTTRMMLAIVLLLLLLLLLPRQIFSYMLSILFTVTVIIVGISIVHMTVIILIATIVLSRNIRY